jgi:hypothetical protein
VFETRIWLVEHERLWVAGAQAFIQHGYAPTFESRTDVRLVRGMQAFEVDTDPGE